MADQQAEQFKQMLLGFIKERPKCLAQLTNSLQQMGAVRRGLDKMHGEVKAALDDPEKRENIDTVKMLNALTKSVNQLAKATEMNTLATLIYVWEGDFDRDSALALNTIGAGDEGLRAFAQSKFGKKPGGGS
jgi:hypothetical protein